MKERPMLFRGEMVRAILEGRKTQTRRLVKNDLGVCEACWNESCPHNYENFEREDLKHLAPYLRVGYCEHNDKIGSRLSPEWNTDERLWVKETYYQRGHWRRIPGVRTKSGRMKWKFVPENDEVVFDPPAEFRKGRHHKDSATVAWHKRLGRFMSRKYSRITREITSIRVERLKEISVADCIAEGIERVGKLVPDRCGFQHGEIVDYSLLWESINGKGSWDKNPWVWVIGFKRV